MKRIQVSENAKWAFVFVLVAALWIGAHFVPWYIHERLPEKHKETAKKTHAYKSFEPLKYNGDTVAFVFQDAGVQRTFNYEWKNYRYKNDKMVSDDIEILKNNNDTIELRFRNPGIQRKFEKEWEKYNGQKLNHMLQNNKKH